MKMQMHAAQPAAAPTPGHSSAPLGQTQLGALVGVGHNAQMGSISRRRWRPTWAAKQTAGPLVYAHTQVRPPTTAAPIGSDRIGLNASWPAAYVSRVAAIMYWAHNEHGRPADARTFGRPGVGAAREWAK